MRNILLVAKHELKVTLGRRSFWLLTFLFPIAILGFNIVTQLASQGLAETDDPLQNPQEATALSIGYVDRAGLIETIPPDIPAGWLTPYADEAQAAAALERGEVDQYFTLAPDFVETGNMDLVSREFSLLGNEAGQSIMRYVVASNLLDSEAHARAFLGSFGNSRMIRNYVRLAATDEVPGEQPAGGIDGPMDTILPFIVMFILFFVLTSSGGYVLQSVSAEKENRTVEVLLGSLPPRELMLGKVLGLGGVSLLQLGVWLVVGGLVFGRGRSLLGDIQLDLPAGFVVYAVLYMLLGYLTYASALAAVGALAPSLREGAQFQMLVLAPLILPVMLNFTLLQEPNGALAVVLSIFPLSAPVSMLMRMTAVPVPFWQIAAGLVGLAGTAYLLVLLAGRFFRADTLLSGDSLNMARVVSEFRRGRAA
jgi:ABC-2 type transport system permease protein